MIFSTLLLIQTATTSLPQPLSEIHQRDIGCVATLAIVADDQRRGGLPSLRFPNVMQRGRKYAGIVGQRVIDETGQPKEVVASAIKQAVEDRQAKLIETEIARETSKDNVAGASAAMDRLVTPCLAFLDKEVPAKETSPDDYRFCAAIISLSVKEIEEREGEQSINAKAMRGLAAQLTQKYQDARFPAGAPLPKLRTELWVRQDIERESRRQAKLDKNVTTETAQSISERREKSLNCLFLGE